MEECRDTRRFSRLARLLIFVFIYFIVALYSFSLEASFNVSSWEVSVGETLYISLEVRNIAPKDVDILVPFTSEHLELVGQKKEQTLISGRSNRQNASEFATAFVLEFKAEKSGTAEIGPFIMTTKDSSVVVPKVFVAVQDAEYQEMAYLFWSVSEDTFYVGEPVFIYLKAQFTGSFDSYTIQVPENMLLEQNDGDLSEALVQTSMQSTGMPLLIARYSMIPLSPGEHLLPESRMTIVDNLGRLRHIPGVTKTVHVLSLYKDSQEKELESNASLAFVEQYKNEKTVIDASLYVQELVNLRRAEYNAFFPAKIRTTRQALEKDLLLLDNPNVPLGAWKIPLLFLSLIFWLISIFFYLVFYKKIGNKKSISILCCIALLLSVVSVYMYVQDRNQHAVVENCTVFQIPEDQSIGVELLSAGTVVMPIKKVSNWYLIQTKKGITGWLPCEYVHIYTRAF